MAAPPWKVFMDFAVERMSTGEKFDPAPAWLNVDRISICRTTGFKARAGCQAVSLYMPSGRAPVAECPTHGGNYYAAVEDDNAPRLFLIEQDGYVESDTLPNEPDRQPSAPYVPPVNVPDDSRPYHDPSPADIIEQRFQNLLKEYGLH